MNSLSTILLSLFLLFSLATAHSFLIVPKGDFKTYNKPECRLGGPPHSPDDNCPGPCISKDAWQYDKNATSTTYARGQNVTMIWTRNNHVGGFVRFALVPEYQRMNRTAHSIMAFRYACYESDKHLCRLNTTLERRCGTDDYLYRTTVTIPTALPDGKYVLGFTWFGGLSMKTSYFSDYWSCSDVHIKGGPFTQTYKPQFIPGKNVPGVSANNPSCPSAVNAMGLCTREPCLGIKGKLMRPANFMGGKPPADIDASWISYTPPSSSHPTGNPNVIYKPPASQAKPTITPTPSPKPSSIGKPLRNAPPRIVGMELVNADTGDVLNSKFNRNVVVTKGVNLTFVAHTTGRVKFVSFFLNDDYVRSETYPPYTFWGDKHGKILPWPKPIFNQWIKITVRATGFDMNHVLKPFWLQLIHRQNLRKQTHLLM